jgi:uncharacterized membrane protein YkvA (DUF1232 family)
MSTNRFRLPSPQREGWFKELIFNLRLIVRLMRDRRVSTWIKLIPVGAVAYWLIPDLVIGPFDDMAVMWFAFVIFMELCPQAIVEEHRQEMLKSLKPAEEKPAGSDPVVINGKFEEPREDEAR